MIRYGEKVICMDNTHGTNMYDFTLITVLIIDDHGEGIPVAWALSNRADTALLTQFLKLLKAKVGDLATNVFMSDMAEQFFKSWIGVFGKCKTKQLYCTWHVDKAWRKGLNMHVKNNEDKIDIYHHLRVLLTEIDQNSFHALLQQFLSYLLNRKHTAFYAYFNDIYVPHTTSWAFYLYYSRYQYVCGSIPQEA